jgi:uncharacterized protein involved in exopolysaccharide biosynthesis
MVENGFKDIDGDDSAEEEGGGFDVERVRELWGFVLRATRRRIKLALATFVIVAAIGLTVATTMPRTYTAEVKLLTQRTSAIRVLSHSDPGMESVDNPTKNVAQMIMRRENLIALVRDAHLPERFAATRPAALRLKDSIMAKVFGPPSADDMEKAMTATLESKLDVKVGEDGIVDITVDWSNPLIAYDLATLVQTNFLEARYDGDVAAINESITILDDHAKNELAIVDAQLEAYQNVVETRIVPAVLAAEAAANSRLPGGGGTPRPSVRGAGPSLLPAAIVDPELTKALEEKRLQIKSLEDSRQRTIDDLRQQLNQAQLTLTPMHPTVITLQQRVDASSQPSPELAQLRAEEHALMAQIAPPRPMASIAPAPAARPTPSPADKDAPPAEPSATATAPSLPIPTTLAQQAPDGPLQLAQSKLEASIRSYQDAVSRSDAARVELDIARAAYKHRYTVFTPAELPKKPKKATAQLVGVGSVFASVLLALLLAAAADMGTGIVIEPWQVRRRLKLDVLGELDNPS